MKNDRLENIHDSYQDIEIRSSRKKFFHKRHPEEESLYEVDKFSQYRYENIEKIYKQIIPDDKFEDARVRSLEERDKLNIRKDDNFVYGEMTFRTLAYIYEIIKISFGPNSIKEGNFYDLGSVKLFLTIKGYGHVCVQAALLHSFNSCVGIELLGSLHKMSQETKVDYDKFFENKINHNEELFSNHKGIMPKLNFIEGNFIQHNWSNASMVFTNSTCFDKNVLNEIFHKANDLSKGSIFINTTTMMPKKFKENWHYVTPFNRLMSWGVAKIFIYRRK